VTPVGSAEYDPAEHNNDAPAPVSISINEINVDNAPVVDVGVEENGDMELPGAEAVGWYRYNATPGEAGSSVLSAHISYNGTNGVFRYLSDVEPGDVVTIGYDDGSTGTFEVFEVAQYDKQELPLDRIFDKDGDPVLTLITCGGDFNSSLRSYEDNFVAYAVPIDA
jgi:LPXTG-site transpeptidase (sortase) family protein